MNFMYSDLNFEKKKKKTLDFTRYLRQPKYVSSSVQVLFFLFSIKNYLTGKWIL